MIEARTSRPVVTTRSTSPVASRLWDRCQRRAERARTDDVGHKVGRRAHRLPIGTAVDAEVAGCGLQQERNRRRAVENAVLGVGDDPRHDGIPGLDAEAGKRLPRELAVIKTSAPPASAARFNQTLVGRDVALRQLIVVGFPRVAEHGDIRPPQGELEAAVCDGQVGADLQNAEGNHRGPRRGCRIIADKSTLWRSATARNAHERFVLPTFRRCHGQFRERPLSRRTHAASRVGGEGRRAQQHVPAQGPSACTTRG